MGSRQNQVQYEAVENGETNAQKTSPILRPLRYRSKSIYLLVLYIAILIIPWILTCIMMVRPVDASSYVHQGFGLSFWVILDILVVWDVIIILRNVQTVLAIPIVSGFFAQAAVVYTQRHSPKQKLTLRQVVTLADRPWSNVILWFRSWSSKVGSRLAFWAGLFVLMVAATPVIENLLVKYEFLAVDTCADTPVYGCNPAEIPVVVGFDPEPSVMDQMPQNTAVQHVAKRTQMVTQLDFQPFMWAENWTTISDTNDINRGTFAWYQNAVKNEKYFVSALTNGTNTGVLREHAIRLNSTSDCVTVPSSEYPTVCPGDRPFVTNLSGDMLNIRICAPGTYGQSPWTLSRDRQDIQERLWIDVTVDGSFDMEMVLPINFTLRCTTKTTRGYFEVNNSLNGNNPGPLLDKWPSTEDLAKDFNDFLGPQGNFAIPSVVDNFTNLYPYTLAPAPVDPYNIVNYYAAGPLMTSAIALFGNQSFFALASNATNSTASSALTSICQFDILPFTRIVLTNFGESDGSCYDLAYTLGSGDVYASLTNMIYTWISAFNDTESANMALEMATYFANEVVLTGAAAQGELQGSRNIYFSEGTAVPKPKWSLAAVITVSILIALQIVGLCLIMAYTQSVPTWTDSFDAFAMLRMGADLQRRQNVRFAGIHDTDKHDLDGLCEVDGIVGVTEEKEQGGEDEHEGTPLARESPDPNGTVSPDPGARRESCDDFDERDGDDRAKKEGLEPPFCLAVGGSGIITNSLEPRRFWRWKRRTRPEDMDV